MAARNGVRSSSPGSSVGPAESPARGDEGRVWLAEAPRIVLGRSANPGFPAECGSTVAPTGLLRQDRSPAIGCGNRFPCGITSRTGAKNRYECRDPAIRGRQCWSVGHRFRPIGRQLLCGRELREGRPTAVPSRLPDRWPPTEAVSRVSRAAAWASSSKLPSCSGPWMLRRNSTMPPTAKSLMRCTSLTCRDPLEPDEQM